MKDMCYWQKKRLVLTLTILVLCILSGIMAMLPAVANAAQSPQGYTWPLRYDGTITQNYETGGHGGTDIAIGEGNDVLAAADGYVKYVQTWDGSSTTNMQSYGNLVIIYHPSKGTATYYAHLSNYTVSLNQQVKQGDVIGHVGHTGNVQGNPGNHLHFELRLNAKSGLNTYGSGDGTRTNPLDYVNSSYKYDGTSMITGQEMTSGYPRTIPDGDYAIVLTSTIESQPFYYLDISGGDVPAANGTNVGICGGTGSPTDIASYECWHVEYHDGFYKITQLNTNVSLDVWYISTESGANVGVCEYNGGTNQQWAISTNGDGYRIQARCSGFSLDNSYQKLETGNNVCVVANNDAVSQRWSFVPLNEFVEGAEPVLPDGNYAIVLTSTVNSQPYYYLDVAGADYPTANGVNVGIAGGSGSATDLPDYELWSIKYKDGFYTIAQKGTNMLLDVMYISIASGANVIVGQSNGGTNQQWLITENENGYRIQARCSGYSLDNYYEILETGNNVVVHDNNNASSQRWSFIPVNRDIAKATVSNITNQTYTGNAITPKPTVKWQGTTLVEGTDYTLSYANNVSAGKATITITGKGSYTGTTTATFQIVKSFTPGWAYENGGYYYYENDGTLRTNSWISAYGAWYYLGSDGKVVTSGWVYYYGRYYYVNAKGNPVANGWVYYYGKYYYMNASGNPVINNWVNYNGKYYYMNSSGNPVVNDWVQYDGTWYHFNNSGVCDYTYKAA